ncbi:DNRLRE domain-containing protein [Jatrophihabitans sp.]|uniref:DNRLRE domain-containing protein n=1 Tax=Jatrophihabitans sp. TaxID=1932789 RepID=UPI002D017BF5|nr:DNRLRE domain-containing protein [Jatrophihabitans sp.]
MARTSLRPARILCLLTSATLVTGMGTAVTSSLTPKAAAAAPAASDARPGELVNHRTRTSMTIRKSDGTLQTILSAGAVHYWTASGWKRIDSELVAADEAGFAYRNKANSFRAQFKGASDGEYLRVSAAGRDFGLSLQGAGQASAKAAGNGLVYPHALGNVDLRYDVLADGVKETLVLPDASSPSTYHFLLSASGNAAFRAERRPDGSWAFYSGTSLAPAFLLDAPVALDAGATGHPSAQTGRNATLDVKKTGQGFTLTLDLDRSWLKAPERRFPVRLDPTITINPPVEDASFAASCANCLPYVSDKIYTGTDSNYAWRGAVQFNLGDLPAGADVTSATLQAYWQPLCITAGTGFCNGTSHQIDAHLMTTSWSTSSTSGALGYASTPIGSATVSPAAVGTSPSWVSWPVTSTLRDWQAGVKPNFGVLLKRATEPLNASGPVFYGRRSSDPALQPRLVVTYPGDGVNLLPPATLHSDGADLRWTPYPSDATAPFTGYQLHRSTVASFTPNASTLLTTITDRAVTGYRDTTAAAGQTFTYKVVTGSVVSSGRTVSLPAVGQASKILQPAAEDGTGTTIAYFPSLVNCAGYGAESLLWVGPQSDATNRALLRFDLRDIPAGATITSAVVSAWHPYTISSAQTVRAYPATAEWSEGTAHSTCSRDSATWYNAYGGVPWAANGADFDGTAAATVTHAGGELPAFDNFDITLLAAKWVTGAVPNHGLVLKQDQETPGTGSLLSYHSDDFSVAPSLRPKLVVSYADGSRPVGPTAAVSAPLNGATVGGSAVSLAAAASDDRRVDQVDFLVDGTVAGSDSTAPFGVTWNSTAAGAGSHTVTVRATDDAGNTTTSASATVTVDNSAVPSTSVTSPAPAAGSSVTGYRTAVSADHPAGWWRLGEASGPVLADASGGGHDGAVIGSPVLGARGSLGSDPDTAMQSGDQGTGSYGSVPASSGWALNGSFTLEWWGKALGLLAYNPGFLRTGDDYTAGDGWSVGWNSLEHSHYLAFVRDGQEYQSFADDSSDPRYYAVVYDSAAHTLQWYIDGQPDVQYTGVTFSAWNGTAHPLEIGRGYDPSTVRVDEPAVYSSALPAARIAAHYTAGSAAAPEVTATVPVAANAADDRGVTAVDFLADGVRYATDTTAPYQASWNTLDPAATVPDGVHVLTTRAYDTSGQVTTSADVPVTVANAKGTQYLGTTGTTEVPDLIPADPAVTQPVQVTVTNDSAVSWPATTVVDSSWISHDATPVTTAGTSAALGTSLAPGDTTTVRLNVPAPTLPDGAQQAAYTLKVDLKDPATGTAYAAKGNKPVTNDVQVAKSLEDTLGLERWHQYRGTDLGAGMQDLVDIANGNNLWRWTPSDSPGRGLSTVVDLTYNSLEKSGPSPVGPGVSLSVSSLTRFGLPIDIHPNKADSIGGNAKRYVVITDGDGTTHRFDGVANADGTWRYEAPPGVHLYLRPTGSTDPARTWAFSRPDRVTFYYDADGYPTSVEDANGNRITYTLERIPPGEDGGPVKKRITAVTDPGGRSYQLAYWSKAEVKKAQVRGELKRLTDHSGSAWDFDYYDDGNLRVITQRGGTKADGSALADRRFVFTYTTSNGDAPAISDPALRVDPDPKTPNQSALVYSIRDPRGAETRFSYYGPGSSQLRGRVNTVTDRAGVVTTYTYDLTARTTTEAAPLSRTQVYTWDPLGRVTVLRNALGQNTTLTWNGDNKVVTLTEPTGRTVKYTYNANGYLTSTTDQLNHTTLLEMEDVAADANDVAGKWQGGRTIPHYSQLKYKTSARGTATATVGDYRWSFGYDARGNLTTTTDPTGAQKTLTINPDGTVSAERDARGGVTGYTGYDANGFPTVVTDQIGRKTQLGYDSDGQLIWTQDNRHKDYTGGNPRDYRTYLDYDSFGRMGRQSTPKSTDGDRGLLIWSGADFDADDNTVLDIDQHYGRQYTPSIAFQVKHAFDAMDRETLRTALDTSADPAGERTSMTYDVAGRLTRMTRPLGVQSTTIADDHAVDYSYDLLDRTVRQAVYEVDAAGVQKSVQYSHTCYDLAGDAVRTVAPRANRATISCTDDTVPFLTKATYDAAHRLLTVTDAAGRITRTGYDDDNNVTSRTDEAGNVETTEFDQRELPVKSVQPFTGGTTPRVLTTLLEYDPNGNRSRVITPRAYDASSDKQTFTSYVTRYVYDAANQLTRTDLPSTGPSDQHYKHQAYDDMGNLATVTQDVTQDTLANVPQKLREDRSYFDPRGWIRTSDDHVNPALHFDYDANGRQTARTPEKKGSSELDPDERQEWHYFIDGMLQERSDVGGQKITYTYDADNVTRTMTDASGANANRQRTMKVEVSPDGLDRPAKTRQRKTDETRWKATLSSYDLSNNLIQRIDDREEDDAGTQLKAGRQNDYTFDGTDRMTQQVDQGKDTQASTSDDTRISTSYLPQGWELQRTTDKYVPGGSPVWQAKKVQDWTYFDNGQLKTMSTKNGSGTVLESHDVSYTDSANRYANGNQTSDVFKRSSPNTGTPCASATCTARYSYDARDRLVHQDSGAGGSADYTLDPAGNVVTEVQSDTGTTNYTYQGTQLDTATTGGVTSKSHYDSHGNLDCVTAATGSDADCNNASGWQIDYSYDGLDRLTGYKDTAGGIDTSYEYDALDRQTRQEKHGSAGGPTTDFSFLGLSDKVTKEEQRGTGGSISRTKDYSYDAYGSANSMTDTPTGQASQQYSYGKDPLGSVSQLIDDTGKASAAYGYKPYGDTDSTLSAGDANKDDPRNPVRFTEKRYDSGSHTLDTGARRFGPSNNRFLQEDRYADALSDLDLSTDPLTANRYSLAGGNPANFVEVDGHFSIGGMLGDAKDAVSGAADSIGDAASDVGSAVGGAVSDAAQFAWDHKVAIGSVAAGIGCGALSAGLAAAGCAAGVAAVSGAIEAKSECKDEGAGCYAKKIGTSVALTAAGGAVGKVAGAGLAKVGTRMLGRETDDAARSLRGAAEDSSPGGTAAKSCMNSFTAGTPVLMADGSQKPIEQVRKGDRVLATDPETEQTAAETVVTPIVHGGPHTMVTVALSDGSSITATDEHPFWDETAHAFVDAQDLHAGDRVLTSAGNRLVVKAIAVFVAVLVAFNLQVDQIHTYYAGVTPVLVHNACGPTSENYRGRFNVDLASQGKKRLPKDWDAHHRIPQSYREHSEFQDFDFDAPSNIRGVQNHLSGDNVHNRITQTWAKFQKQYPNATRSQIERFAKRVDRGYGQRYWRG